MADKPCRYDRLAATLAFVTGQPPDDRPPCEEPSAFYVSIVARGPDWSVEMLQNLCPAHEKYAHRVDGWQWSRHRRSNALSLR